MHIKNCLICKKEAKRWTGHIHTEIGQIISGWCDEHYLQTVRPLSSRCTSTNPHSCGGEYKLSEIELLEEMNEENLLQHARNEAFSEKIDKACSPNYNKNKKRTFWSFFKW